MICSVAPGSSGSPPPMRGKVTHRAEHHTAKRITPAYAGKSTEKCLYFSEHTDHPRLCGEKFLTDKFSRSNVGSPPPMRGKGDFPTVLILFLGITPAYAGKSSAFIRSSPVNQDPPRLCGEKHRRTVFCDRLSGSPPPMRGKVHAFTCFFPLCRITPAYAGKSEKGLSKRQRNQDHPRLCGEKYYFSKSWNVMIGSPPPMRGKAKEAI